MYLIPQVRKLLACARPTASASDPRSSPGPGPRRSGPGVHSTACEVSYVPPSLSSSVTGRQARPPAHTSSARPAIRKSEASMYACSRSWRLVTETYDACDSHNHAPTCDSTSSHLLLPLLAHARVRLGWLQLPLTLCTFGRTCHALRLCAGQDVVLLCNALLCPALLCMICIKVQRKVRQSATLRSPHMNAG